MLMEPDRVNCGGGEELPSGLCRTVVLDDRTFLMEGERASWLGTEYAQAIFEWMRGIGFEPDRFGRYGNICPHTVAFTSDLWEVIQRQMEQPGAAVTKIVEKLIPRMQETYKEHLRECMTEDLRGGAYKAIDLLLDTDLSVSGDPEVWLNAPVRLNLGLTVDAFSDYTLNVTYPAYEWEEYESEWKGAFHWSSIMWLTRRQGYTQARLREAQHNVKRAAELPDPHTLIPSKYLYSAAMEIWHELSIYNQLGFFVRVPLKEALLAVSMQICGKRSGKGQGYFLLDRSTTCGFFTTWEGSCSLLGIEMEKDVRVPLADLDIFPDGADGYALFEVHGSSEKWQPDKILHWGFPRDFVPRIKREDPALYRCVCDLRAKEGAARN